MFMRIQENDFIQAFKDCRRQDNFSYEGLRNLFAYLEEYEAAIGEQLELDVIALCCEYVEYENIAEYNEAYSEEHESMDDITETDVIPIDSEAFIIRGY